MLALLLLLSPPSTSIHVVPSSPDCARFDTLPLDEAFLHCGASLGLNRAWETHSTVPTWLLKRDDVVRGGEEVFSGHDWSRVVPPVSRETPAFAVWAFKPERDVDVELCLEAKTDGPVCGEHPERYALVNMEDGDVLFVDPTKAVFRVCQGNVLRKGCVPVVWEVKVDRYALESFFVPNEDVVPQHFRAWEWTVTRENNNEDVYVNENDEDAPSIVSVNEDDNAMKGFVLGSKTNTPQRLAKIRNTLKKRRSLKKD